MANPLEFLRSASFYFRGLKHYRARRWASAEALFTLAVQDRPDFAEALFKLGMCHFRQEDWQSALVAMQAAIDLDPSSTRWTVQRDQALAYLEGTPPASLEEAEEQLRARLAADDTNAETHAELANIFGKQGRYWQEIVSLREAVARAPQAANLHFKLGDALDRMRRYRQAAEAFSEASALDPDNATYAFRAGFAFEREGFDGPADPARAREAYNRAIAADKTGAATRFGIGVFHQKRGYWTDAATAYEQQLKRYPHDAELLYRLGLSQDRVFEWAKAEQHISRSLILDPSHAHRHARLGFVLERQGKFLEAAAAYGFAAEFGGKDAAERRYRQGLVLARHGAFAEAVEAFLKMEEEPDALAGLVQCPTANPYAIDLAEQAIQQTVTLLQADFTSPELHLALARAHDLLGDWQAAAEAYADAIARNDEHVPDCYFRLGVCLARIGRLEEACEAFIETRCLTAADGGIPHGNLKNPDALRRARYAEYYERLPIKEKTVLYESFHGRAMSCNPLAIFRQLLAKEDFGEWTHIWVIDDRNKIPQEFRALRNVIFLSRQSDGYMRALASAQVLVNNATFPAEFTRRDGQTYLNTWHGTPIKTLGKFIGGGAFDHANTARNFLQATHLLSPNPHTSKVLIDHYDIGGLFTGEIAETGYPRIDATVAMAEDERERLRARLGAEPGQKIMLYAPTFRGSFGSAEVDSARLVSDLQAMHRDGYHLLFRGHYETERLIANLALSCTVVPEDIDSNSLLSVVDLLITDYSSIAFDYLPRRKPIVYYAYDLEEYESERGLYFPLSDLPGEIVQTREALRDAIANCERHIDAAEQESAVARFCPMDDGHVSNRVIDWVFHGIAEGIKVLPSARPSDILFYPGSMIPNGITTSFINLTNHIDPAEYAITCLIDSNVSQHKDRIEQVGRLPESLQIVARVGARLFTLEESWVEAKFDSQHQITEPMFEVLRQGYTRELRRELGPMHVDTMINFDGYTRFFQRLFAFAPAHAAKRKAMYLHNDMASEWRERFPYLEGAFRTYSRFDALVSVSETLRDLNRAHLSDNFAIPSEKFVFAENIHNPNYIRTAAENPIESAKEQALFDDAEVTFLTMGRMSVEKDQAKLVRAFKAVASAIPTARLFVLGDGPLRKELDATIKALKLTDNVFLLGQKPNPFPYLKRADCFVLPSNHEGQPMVLLEALILDRPIIATNISGNRGALKGRPGRIVENSEEGLAAAMLDFAKSPTPNSHFDIDAYQRNALDHFIGVLKASVRP